MPEAFPVLIALFVLLAVGLAVWGWHAAGRRREAVRKLAGELGLDYFPGGVGGVSGHAGFFERLLGGDAWRGPYEVVGEDFDRGHSTRPTNTMHGRIDVEGRGSREVYAGDWRYKTGGGKHEATHRFSYVLLAAPEHGPRVRVRPESFLDSAAATFGFNDLDFESVEFSDAYHVSADDERYAYALFHPPMIEFFLRERPPRVTVGNGWVLVRGEGTLSPNDLRRSLAIAARVVTLWPRHLLAGGR